MHVSEAARSIGATRRAAWVVFAGMLALAGGWMMFLTRGGTFHYDEWNFVLNRRGHSLDTFFSPHNEHLVAVPVLAFKTLFATVGLAHYWPYQLMPILLHFACALLIYILARRQLGDWWALIPAGWVVFLGAGANTILWPFQIGFLIPVVTFLGALLLVERNDLRGDVAAAALLTIGLASSGIGPPMTVGIAAYLLLGEKRLVRLVRVVGIPLVLYALWDARYGVTEPPWDDVLRVPRLVADQLAGNLAAIMSSPDSFGPVLAVLFVLGVAIHVISGRPLTPRFVAATASLFAFFAVLSLFRPGQIGGRYLYPGGVLLILALAELAPAYVVRRPSTRALALGSIAVVFVLSGQLTYFIDAGKFFRDWARFVPTSLGALELARDYVEPSFRPDPVRAPDVYADKYFDTTRAYGSPAASPAEIRRRPEDARQNADVVLAAALRLGLKPADRPRSLGPIPHPTQLQGGGPRPKAGCLTYEPYVGGSWLEVQMPAEGLWLRPGKGANAEVRLRRFADTYPVGDEPPGKPLFGGFVVWDRDFIKPLVMHAPDEKGSVLVIPPDRASNIPWYALVTTNQPVEICARGA
jgi:hypothetical protein